MEEDKESEQHTKNLEDAKQLQDEQESEASSVKQTQDQPSSAVKQPPDFKIVIDQTILSGKKVKVAPLTPALSSAAAAGANGSKQNQPAATSDVADQEGEKSHTFACGKGNYPNHVIRALKARGNWSQIPEEQAIDNSHFYWRQTNLNFQAYHEVDNRIKTSTKELFLNHFENTRGITTKTGLITSLQKYYLTIEAAVRACYTGFDTTPTTFIISRVTEDDEMHLLMTRYKEIAR